MIGAGQRVLDGHHRGVGLALHHRREQLVEVAAGHGVGGRAEEAAGGVLAEGPLFSLKGGANAVIGRWPFCVAADVVPPVRGRATTLTAPARASCTRRGARSR